MNLVLFSFGAAGLLLLALLAVALGGYRRKPPEITSGSLEDRDVRHVSYLSYINQALGPADIEFLKSRGASPALAQRVEKERRQVALKYLKALRSEFDRLVEFARVVAVMSPDVKFVHELQSFRQQLRFSYRYHLIYARLAMGLAPSNALADLSDSVSSLTSRMEAAIGELGEGATLGFELSQYDNRGAS